MFCSQSSKKRVARIALAVLTAIPIFAAEPLVKTVPWIASDPSIPHDTFLNRGVTLKGTSSLQGPQIHATWDFGDGSEPATFPVADRYNVSARHAYVGATDTLYTATLTVTDTTTNESASASYLVMMREKTLAVEVNIAIDEGLWYLHRNMVRGSLDAGTWAGTCTACDPQGASDLSNALAFENNGHLASGDASDPYTETVARVRKILPDPAPDGTAPVASSRARSANLEAILAVNNTLDLDAGTLWSLTQTLRAQTPPVTLLDSGTPGISPLDWFNAEISRGDSIDGVARVLVNRQDDAGSWSGHSSAPGDAPLETARSIAMLSVSPRFVSSSVTNVSAQVTFTVPGFPLNRSTNTFNGTLTVKNISGSSIAGPVSVGFSNLPAGIALSNSNGTFNGAPFINLTGSTMNPGDTASVVLKFTNSGSNKITFTATTYSGSMPPSALGVSCPTSTVTVNTPYSSALVGSGGSLAYTYSISVGSLPHNLSLNASTGAITGTPDTTGPSNFTGKVTDSAGGTPQTATAACSISVNPPTQAPAFTSSNTATFQVGNLSTFNITTSGTPTVTTINSVGTLPSGLMFTDNGNGTAKVSGTPGAGTGAAYALNLTATNGVNPDAMQTLTVNVNQAPAITSANNTTFKVGTNGTFTVTTTGFPKPSIARGGVALPSAVTYLDNGDGTGTLSGTPVPGTVNTYAITFTATNAVSSTAPQIFTFTVAKGDQTINFTSTAPASAQVGGPTYNVTATATSGLTVAFTIDASASSVCSISGSTVSFIGVGTCVIDANQAGNADYNAAPQAQQSFAVGKNDQTITFTSSAPAGAKVAGPTYTVTATATSSLTVAFTIDASASSVCSISGSTVSFIGAGTCVIDANQAGNANYNAAPQVQQSFAVAKGDQTINFTSTAPAGAKVGGPTYTVTATATSGLTVAFTIDASASSVCSISGSTVSFIGVGTCVIDANQAGNANYNAAPQAQQSFAVAKGDQAINFTSTAPAGAKVGGATYTVTATASSGLVVTLTIDASASSVCSISGSTVSFIGVGTCVIDANQAGNANYNAAPQAQQSFAVGKGDQTITFTSTAPAGAKVAGPTYTVTATASSGLTVAFTIDASASSVCSISGSTVSFIGAGTCVIDANQAGNATYNAAPQVQQSFAVAKGDQTINFTSTAPAGAKVAGPTYNVTATATSGLAVTFTIDPSASSVCTISGSTVSFIGVGTCVIDANQAGNANYNAAPQVQQSFAVAKGDQTINFTSTAPAGAKVGGPTYTVTATASSGLVVTLTIDASASAVCSISGSTVSFLTPGTCVIDANQAGNTNYNAAPQAQQSFAVAKGDQTISFTSTAPVGQKVAGPTYNVTATATSGLTVAFTIDASASSVCTISGSTVSFIGVGTCVIDANQPGDTNYNAAPQAQQSFTVIKGDQTISFTSTAPTNAQVSGPTYTVTATATSGLTVTFTIDASATTKCSISGSTVSFIGGGTCVIDANQAGNANYNAAPQVQQSFTVFQPPAITSVNNATFTYNSAGTFSVTTTGFPTNASMSISKTAGTLPSGTPNVTLVNNNNGTATLSGTPTQTGTFLFTITASNGVSPDATQNFTLSVLPVAVADSYNSTFGIVDNTQFAITGGGTATPATPAVTATGNILSNDLPTGAVSAVAGSITTSAGGNVVLQTDGTFLYTPKANPGGAAITSDSFMYQVTSNTGGTATPTTSLAATVSLTLANRVWYVKNNGAGTIGQSQSPFQTLSAAIAASTANDFIFVYQGDGATTNQATASALKTGQSLIGQGVALVVNSHTLVAAGGTPLIGNTVTLANSVTVNGLDMSTGGSTGISGTSVTGVNVTPRDVTTTTGTAVSIGGSGNTGTYTFRSISTNGALIPISLSSTSGTFIVNGDGTGHANGSGGTLANSGLGGTNTLGQGPIFALTATGTITLKSMNIGLNTAAFNGALFDNNAGGTLAVNITGCTFTGVSGSVNQNKALLQFEGGGASNVTANVQNSFFFNNRTYGFVATAAGTSIMDATLNQSGFGTDVNTGAPVNQPGTTITNAPPFSVLISNGSAAQLHYNITNNTFWGARAADGALYAVTISGASTTGSLNGFFKGNKMGKTGSVGSGCLGNCAGLGLLPGTGGTFNATVGNNDIRQVGSFGINLANTTTGSNVNIIGHLTNNTLAENDTTSGAPAAAMQAIHVAPSPSGGATVNSCAEITGNNISGGWQAVAFIRISTTGNTGTMVLPGLSPTTGATAAQVDTFVAGNNTLTGGSVSTTIGATGPIDGGSACTPTP